MLAVTRRGARNQESTGASTANCFVIMVLARATEPGPAADHRPVEPSKRSKEICDCARWIVTKQRADWQDVLDYADQPRCGQDSWRRECLAKGAEPRACTEGENPFPFKDEVASP